MAPSVATFGLLVSVQPKDFNLALPDGLVARHITHGHSHCALANPKRGNELALPIKGPYSENMTGTQQDAPAPTNQERGDFFHQYRLHFSGVHTANTIGTDEAEEIGKRACEEGSEEEQVDQFILSALESITAENQPQSQSFSKDMAFLKRAISAIVETKDDNILEENEAKALIKFVLLRFVEKRFSRTLHTMLPSSGKRWFVKGYKAVK